MDLNLNLGLPLCPPPLSVDLGYDLALNALPLDFGDDDVFMRLPPIDSLLSLDDIPDPENLFEPFDLPSYGYIRPIPVPSEDRRNNSLNSVPYAASLTFDNEPLARTGGPRLPLELLECPEFRFQRLIESRDRWEMARTRSSRDNSSARSATDPERLMRDIRRSERLVGSIGKHKAADKAQLAGGSAEEENEKSGCVTDFDCNICLELAKEPVVTSCGHLFCWPCLYQWLYVHCNHKECPVCKGKVNESNMVPIYGRGGSEASGKKKDGEDAHQGLNIPPRPQGNRVESLRQQFHGPLFRTSEIIHGMNELMSQLPEGFQLFRRVERNPQPARTTPSMPPATAGSSPQDGRASQQQNRLQRSNPVTIITGFHRREQPATVTVSDDSHDPAPSPSQASTSSTMAVIQGDSVPPGAPAEPNRGGAPMVLRRRRRSRTTSDSLDANGRARQRRRFHPSDFDVVDYYLRRKIRGESVPEWLIMDLDVYDYEPQCLPCHSFPYQKKKTEMYFFTRRRPTSSGSKRASRTVGGGVWHGCGADILVRDRNDNDKIIGHKTQLNFKILVDGNKKKTTKWIMHEYRLDSGKKKMNKFDELVLCRIYRKMDKAAGDVQQQYGAAPVGEEADDDAEVFKPLASSDECYREPMPMITSNPAAIVPSTGFTDDHSAYGRSLGDFQVDIKREELRDNAIADVRPITSDAGNLADDFQIDVDIGSLVQSWEGLGDVPFTLDDI